MYRTDSVAISSFKNIFFQYRLDFARNGGSSRAELIIRPLAFYFYFFFIIWNTTSSWHPLINMRSRIPLEDFVRKMKKKKNVFLFLIY
jgi:hypothetical protein